MDTTAKAAAPQADVAQIQAFMRGASFEATRPSAADVAALGETLPRGTLLYLTAIPGKPLSELLAATQAARAAGLEPVPHLSARHFPDMAAVDAFVAEAVARAQVRTVLLVGGDIAEPKGTVRDALSVIESGVFEKHGIRDVGLAGFPDGHPQMSEDELEANLLTKLAALQRHGVDSHVVTQFCFDARPILSWLAALRGRGVQAPVRIGLAGPTNLLTWLNYARRCGVKASAEALASRSGLVKQAFRPVAPDPLIRTLAGAAAAGLLEGAQAHFFAFGGVTQTAKWALAPMTGAIRLTSGGFDPA
ncbi:MAG TPA: methylenetetrahydrofolate reductase [Beijerinckiaceae bacterium]